MNEKFGVHGQIEIELKKKHCTRIYRAENQLTQFGKSYVMSTGFGGLLSCNNANVSNKIRCSGKKGFTVSDSANAVGPYTINYTKQVADGSRITNMLLNNPTLAVDSGVYIPSDAELAGFAYNDTNVSGTLKEGTNTLLKDSQIRSNRLARRFEYSTDLACEFNTIAMSTLVPNGVAGRIADLLRSIQPQTYSSSSNAAITYINPVAVKDGLFTFTAQNGTTYTVSLDTGVIAESGSALNISLSEILSAFSYGNYTYVVYLAYDSGIMSRALKLRVFDSTNTQVADFGLISASSIPSLVCINGTFYIYGSKSSSTVYTLVEGSDGWLVKSASTVAAPITLPDNYFYTVCGSDNAYTNVALGARYQSSSYYILANNMYFVDATFNTVGTAQPFTGCAFKYGNRTFAVGHRQINTGWAQKLDGLIEYGNLLSYHTLNESIQKNVGDTMYITYSYIID